MIEENKEEFQPDMFEVFDRQYIMQMISAKDGSKSPPIVSSIRELMITLEVSIESEEEDYQKFTPEFWNEHYLNVMFDLEMGQPSIVDCVCKVPLMLLSVFHDMLVPKEAQAHG